METVKFDMAYMFAYSMRKKTHAYHRMTDSVPEEVKKRRLNELVSTFYSTAAVRNQRFIGTHQLVLVEGFSKRSNNDLAGRTDGGIKVIFPCTKVPCDFTSADWASIKPGDYVHVQVTGATALTLRGVPVVRTTLQNFHRHWNGADTEPA